MLPFGAVLFYNFPDKRSLWEGGERGGGGGGGRYTPDGSKPSQLSQNSNFHLEKDEYR